MAYLFVVSGGTRSHSVFVGLRFSGLRVGSFGLFLVTGWLTLLYSCVLAGALWRCAMRWSGVSIIGVRGLWFLTWLCSSKWSSVLCIIVGGSVYLCITGCGCGVFPVLSIGVCAVFVSS